MLSHLFTIFNSCPTNMTTLPNAGLEFWVSVSSWDGKTCEHPSGYDPKTMSEALEDYTG